MDILYYGNIPNGSGLSSSASIEVLTTYIIKELYNIDISKDISLLSQYAENKYVGVNCGIMDQFAVAMGKKNHAIFPIPLLFNMNMHRLILAIAG